MNTMKLSGITTLLALFIASAIFAQDKQEEFKPSGKLWGYTFGDFYYKAAGDTTLWGNTEFAKVKKDNYAFTFRRIYLGYDYNISRNFSAKILLESSDAVLNSKDDKTVFLKALDLEWKNLIPRASIFIGQTSTPTWSLLSEKIWGYRSIEKTITDKSGLGTAVDLGVRVSGKIDSAGRFGYSLMVGNGRAAKPENNRLKKVYGSVDAQLLNKKLIVELYGDYEDNSDSSFTYTNGSRSITNIGNRSKTTLKGFVAYQHTLCTVGLEVVEQIQVNNKINTDTANVKILENITPLGMSLFIKGNLLKDKLNAFVKFYAYDIDINYLKGDDVKNPYTENTILVGFDYMPHPSVHIMPNIYINTYTDKREKPSNYDVTKDYKKYYERTADITPRLTFYYIFR